MNEADIQLMENIALHVKHETQFGAYRGVPNGHLYASLMAEVTFDKYCSMISLLKKVGIITEKGNLLQFVEGSLDK